MNFRFNFLNELSVWPITFAIWSVLESAIRIFYFHDSWAVGVSFSYIVRNLEIAIICGFFMGICYFSIVAAVSRSRRNIPRFFKLISPGQALAVTILLMIPFLFKIRSLTVFLHLKHFAWLRLGTIGSILLIVFALLFLIIRRFLGDFQLGKKKGVFVGLSLFVIPILATLFIQFLRGHALIKNPQAKGPVRNIVLISIDTLRFDYVGAYGATNVRTPVMDQIASEGAIFLDAVSLVPETGPSHITMLTGLPTLLNGVQFNGQRLSRSAWTIVQQLQREGFQTAAFISGSPLQIKNCGLDRGFQTYDDRLAPIDDFNESYLGQLLESSKIFRPGILRTCDKVTNPALTWLRSADKSFFLFLHYYDVHYPYDYAQKLRKHPRWITSTPQELPQQKLFYAEAIHRVDTEIGRVVDVLKAKKIYDKTLVIVTSDHGESLGEHNYYYDHDLFVYEQSLHVPLIIRCPALIQGRTAVKPQVSLVDISKTILESVGLTPERKLAGCNLIALSQDKACSYDPVVVSHAFQNKLQSVRRQPWKLIRNAKHTPFAYELYDLASDPQETVNLYNSRTDEAKKLQRWFSEVIDTGFRREDLSPEQLEALQSLGYFR